MIIWFDLWLLSKLALKKEATNHFVCKTFSRRNKIPRKTPVSESLFFFDLACWQINFIKRRFIISPVTVKYSLKPLNHVKDTLKISWESKKALLRIGQSFKKFWCISYMAITWLKTAQKRLPEKAKHIYKRKPNFSTLFIFLVSTRGGEKSC